MSMTSHSRRRTAAGLSCRYMAATSPAEAGVVARVHGRVDLDAGRHADDRHTVAHSVADVARGAVAAGEEDQVHAGGEQVARRLLGVGRRREHKVVAGDMDVAADPLHLAGGVAAAAVERQLEPRTIGSNPAASASSAPISPGQVTMRTVPPPRARRSSAWRAARRVRLPARAPAFGPGGTGSFLQDTL